MTSFENRQVDHINRKRLNVVSGNYTDDGKIVSLVVDVVREDGYKDGDTVGTRFDKESFETIIKDYIFKNVLALSFIPEKENYLEITETMTYQIKHKDNIVLYPKANNDGGTKFDLQVSYNTSGKYVSVSFDLNPYYSSAYTVEKNVGLYLDSSFTKLYCNIPFRISFTPSSTGSGD